MPTPRRRLPRAWHPRPRLRGCPPSPPAAKRARSKASIQGGGGLRARGKDAKGRIDEHDRQRDTVGNTTRSSRPAPTPTAWLPLADDPNGVRQADETRPLRPSPAAD
ncbi:colicin E3/pyocin S6 family cytotoxin [Streptomyces sp. NBC_00667]|uniref:colicin E3/pyocin S6 family cytotoxin n=1 Tax=unclassified Streptomyces TaxID=2593676 RepID=UPI003FA6D871